MLKRCSKIVHKQFCLLFSPIVFTKNLKYTYKILFTPHSTYVWIRPRKTSSSSFLSHADGVSYSYLSPTRLVISNRLLVFTAYSIVSSPITLIHFIFGLIPCPGSFYFDYTTQSLLFFSIQWTNHRNLFSFILSATSITS